MTVVLILYALWRRRTRGLWKLPHGRDWLWGNLGLVLMGRGMLSKSLIQFSIDGLGCVSFLLFDLRPNCSGGNENHGDLLQKVCVCTVVFSAPDPATGHCQPTSPPETPKHSQASLDQSLVGSLFLSPWSWCTQSFTCALQESLFLSPVEVL